MPAIRGGVRRDVIIRVPKIDVKTRRGSAVSLIGGDLEERDKRRSMSPVKRIMSQVEGESHKQLEQHKKGSGGEQSYEYAAQATSTAEWNSLLIWARRQRGPQWDTATGLWQVDQGSSDYYSFGNDPARHTKLSTAVEDESAQVTNVKVSEEGNGPITDERDAEGPNDSHSHQAYGEDSPPIGPGIRRSRLR